MKRGDVFDVIIMGGGPGGATLAAMLARRTRLRVAVFEKDVFPRDHIGESLIARLTLLLEQTGALGPLLASDCHVRKAGGFFDWDPGADPHTLFFSHDARARDGFSRWALHVNRADFDRILLDHARASGAHVFQGEGAVAVERRGERTRVKLEGGREVECRVLADASGRQTSLLGVPRAFLSRYKNIAIWNHYVGCKNAQTLPGDWNIFREEDLSPIGNFVCDDGWFWYIPVRKTVNGERVTTHSVGLVTDPDVLKHPSKRYTDPEVFLDRCLRTPRLADLMAGARAISGEMLTATNYSMISDRLSDYDERWLLLGDVGFFVDPLFSSGVTLAVSAGISAAFVIEATFDERLPEAHKRDLWADYHTRYRSTAETLARMIDQWYHAIGRAHPGSIYQKLRAEWPLTDPRGEAFPSLLNLTVLDAILDYSIPADQKPRWAEVFQIDGARDGVRPAPHLDLDPESTPRLAEGVGVRPGATLGTVPVDVPGEYWTDPVANGPRFLHTTPYQPCYRFFRASEPEGVTVPFVERVDRGLLLQALLQQGSRTVGALLPMLAPPQRRLFDLLARAGMITFA